MKISPAASLYDLAEQLGLPSSDLDQIIRHLGRDPTHTELAMFSVEWSEHCSYRRSRRHFAQFPRTGKVPALIGEDAGGVLLDDLAILFKVESHNHPSQVEPRQGAATGVGGIIRDIVAGGARPMALLDSLRFGPLAETGNRHLLRGVVDGIQWYGNLIGIPTVGGETDFHPAYSGNCLVNILCVGIAEKDKLLTSKAKSGCSVMILGSQTGRDGIGGCSVLASQEMRESLRKRPSVQIGDPFFGKCLLEATLEAASQGLFVALKDMGAAGLTCTTSEMSAAGGCGMEIEVSKIPAREAGMEAWEFMMSESQERMLAVVSPGREEEVQKIFRKWGLKAEVIGKTIPEKVLKISRHNQEVASLPTEFLVEPPPIFPEIQKQTPAKTPSKFQDIPPLSQLIPDFLALPSLISKQWIYRQYDHMVQTNTVAGPGMDAAVLRVKDKPWGLAVTMEGNGRYCKADPFLGAQYIAAEAARNLVAVGAVPLAVSDGLNFGNPEKPEAYGEFVSVVEGLALACRQLHLPIVSGNVSFYNETSETLSQARLRKVRILPTPILGAIGQCKDVNRITRMNFQREGDLLYLLGPPSADLSGSLLLEFLQWESRGLPALDWEIEKNVQNTCLELQEKELLASCHDIGQGGLMTALAECIAESQWGAEVHWKRNFAELFSESPSRFLVSVSAEKKEPFEKLAKERKTPFLPLGEVKGTKFSVIGQFQISREEIADLYQNRLQEILEQEK